MDRSEKFWDRISNMYAKTPISDEVAYQNKLNKIKDLLHPEGVLFDYGCGTGSVSIALSGYVREIHGVDISSKMLEIAHQRIEDRNIKNVRLNKLSIFDSAFDAGSYDVVLAMNVLHFIDDIDMVLARLNSLLKPNGYLITETPCMGENKTFLNKLMYCLGRMGLIPRLNILTFESFEDALLKSGFDIQHKENLSAMPRDYLVFAKKKESLLCQPAS